MASSTVYRYRTGAYPSKLIYINNVHNPIFRSSIKTGRAKRNATFPGGIATTYISQYAGSSLQTPPVKCEPAADRLFVPSPPPAETPASAAEEILTPAASRRRLLPTDGRPGGESGPLPASPEASSMSPAIRQVEEKRHERRKKIPQKN